MAQSTKRMLERKVKLGEYAIIADASGQALKVTAEEALHLFCGNG